ncbi:hypothetical protein SAMN02745217_04234 [Anaerocolumna xylanovorans DSM 12503]|uniref:Uncharacterized protein n=2 Tax=Anaerocolumna TaxID=1843210 RepID=A0A1M7YMB9_9FIRM|nr:hypothetical protein SAMN02745217_04234 [Anaerocolumna xylanovorans DSM 12503]
MIDELKIYRGDDLAVSKNIVLHQPTLNEICDYGEKEYFHMVSTLTSVGADLKWQLDNIGIDYTKIDDFELFYKLFIKMFTVRQTSIIFGDTLDFTKFELCTNTLNNELCLVQQIYSEEEESENIVIDKFTYSVITDYLRKIHGFKTNEQLPANESTKRILIEDDRDAYLLNKNKEHHSYLLNLISAMINSEGFKYDHTKVWNMKINAFMDSIKRISKIKNADLLLQSGYSGYGINLKEIDQKQLDWYGELN